MEATQGVSPTPEESPSGNGFDFRLIDSYDGSTDVVEWYTQASLLCEYRGLSLGQVLPMRLKGGAFAVWSQLPAEDRRSVEAVRDALFTAFAMDDCAAYAAFTARTLQPGESVDVYLASLRRYATLFGGVTDRLLAAAFVNGLPPAVGDTVRAGARAEKLTLTSTLARARAVLGSEQVRAVAAARADGGRRREPGQAAVTARRHDGRRQESGQWTAAGDEDGDDWQQRRRFHRPARRCWTCGEAGHLAASCPRGPGNDGGASSAPAQCPQP